MLTIKGHLDDTHTVYHHRSLSGREFDVCVLLPGIGILVIEVKGWHPTTVKEVLDGHRILIHTENGDRIELPKRQARGYRHLLVEHIHRKFDKRPLVFEMVAYPYISSDEYHQKCMHVVSEENFTFLQDDMRSPQAFMSKLNAAVSLTSVWHRDHFGVDLENQVRSLFEPKYERPAGEPRLESNREADSNIPHAAWLVPTYSRLTYLPDNSQASRDVVDELVRLYGEGTKIWLLTPQKDLLSHAGQSLAQLLADRGLKWENKRMQLSDGAAAPPPRWISGEGFVCFNFETVLCPVPVGNTQAFSITNGEGADSYSELLRHVQSESTFNYDQFLIEHAPASKNVLVRAGAGTGKTHVMISRIIYLCYTDAIFASALLQRLVMITFTNDATENMKKRLKRCFQDYYMLTGKPGFLELTGYVDGMQISTIHSYARTVLAKTCTVLGLGQEVRISSGATERKETLKRVLSQYIEQKDPSKLMPELKLAVYELEDLLLQLINKLTSRNVDVASLNADSFGEPADDPRNKAFHNVVCEVLPRAELELNRTLRANNKIHLSCLMSTLRDAVEQGSHLLAALKGAFSHYLFVDEFQDTDDVQIAALLKIAACMGSRLFVVGDTKQCIYRFRGADEQAFSLLGYEDNEHAWFLAVLNQNYRTDARLLSAFSRPFAKWGKEGLLRYEKDEKELSSKLKLNRDRPEAEFYRRLPAMSPDDCLSVLFDEVEHYRREIESLLEAKEELSSDEKTIAIIVRENWQAEAVRVHARTHELPKIEVHKWGDLFKSPPALDLLTLVQALINNQSPKHLYALLASNLFKIPISKKYMYDLRYSTGDPGSARDKQLKYLVSTLNNAFTQVAGAAAPSLEWNELLRRFRTKPVLQVLRELYQLLCPWERYSSDEGEQHSYRLNIDQVFELIIEFLNIDNLTLHSLADYLQICVITQAEVACRLPEHRESSGVRIVCVTAHKAKGLEYGFVIVPYANFRINELKDNQLDADFSNGKVAYRLRTKNSNDGSSELRTVNYNANTEAELRRREEARVLYVAMTRSIRAFSWVHIDNSKVKDSWQTLLAGGGEHAL